VHAQLLARLEDVTRELVLWIPELGEAALAQVAAARTRLVALLAQMEAEHRRTL